MSYQILVLKTNVGYEPLAYKKGEFSKREIRRFTKKFRKDEDVIEATSSIWVRFYDTIGDMKRELPEVTS